MNNSLSERLKEIEEASKRDMSQNTQTEPVSLDELDVDKEALKDFAKKEFFNDTTEPAIKPDEEVLETPVVEKHQETEAEKAARRREIAEKAKEKYAPAKISGKEPEPEPYHDPNEIGGDLFDGLEDIEQEIAMNKQILDKQVEIEEEKKVEAMLVEDQPTDKKKAKYIDTESIDDIISHLEDEEVQSIDEPDLEDPDELEKYVKQLESEKKFAEIQHNETPTGPAQYFVEADEDYATAVEDILMSNNINIIRKPSNDDRIATLDRFTNSGDKVSMPLMNSGIYIQTSGVGTQEVIAMQQMTSESERYNELNKLQHVCQHITGSSIGKMKISQLIKVVSYYDKDSLYYALFAGTYPKITEHSRTCSKCGKEIFMNIDSRDLLLNAEDFEHIATDIRDNVTTFNRLMETSELGKVYKSVHNGMLVYYKHPSIESYLTIAGSINDDTKTKYPGLVDLAYSVVKIVLPAGRGQFIEFTDPNEIIDIIGRIKDPSEKYAILDMIQDITPSGVPVYGYKECNCPHCGALNPQVSFPMETLLFTKAQVVEQTTQTDWAVRLMKKRQKTKKK